MGFLDKAIGPINAEVYNLELQELSDPNTINEKKIEYLIKKAIKDGRTAELDVLVSNLNTAEMKRFNDQMIAVSKLKDNESFVYGARRGDTSVNLYSPTMSDDAYKEMFDEYTRLSNSMFQLDKTSKFGKEGAAVYDSYAQKLNNLSSIQVQLLKKEEDIHKRWIEGEGASRMGQGTKRAGLAGSLADLTLGTIGTVALAIADQVENVKYLLPEHKWSEGKDDLPTMYLSGWANRGDEHNPEWQAWEEEYNQLEEEIRTVLTDMESTFGKDLAKDMKTLMSLQVNIDKNNYIHYKYMDEVLEKAEDYGLEFNDMTGLYELIQTSKSGEPKLLSTEIDSLLNLFEEEK